MTESDSAILAEMRTDTKRLADNFGQHLKDETERWEKIGPLVAVLTEKAHSFPCQPMQERVTLLEREQAMAKGAIKASIFGLGIPAFLLALIALWKILTK